MLDSEFEPALAVNPRNPRNLVTAWMQGHRESGGGAGLGGAFTRDGGERWGHVTFPESNRCTGADDEWDGAGDPWLSFGPDDTAYLASLSGQEGEIPGDPLGAFEFNTRLLVHRSLDGGATWSPPVEIPQPIVADDRFPDREILTADPGRPGHAYLIWTLIDDPVGPRGTYFSRTTDRGRTWSTATLAFAVGNGESYGMNALLVLPDGDLLAIVKQNTSTAARPILASRSSDQGRSWSRPRRISDDHARYRTFDPDTGAEKFDAGSSSTASLAPNGDVYVVWQDTSPSSSRLLISRSADGGESWSTPTAMAACSCQAFKPLVAVAEDGTVGVVYYDDRNDTAGDGEWTVDVWFAHSHDRGATWPETHLGGPFDYRQPPGEDSAGARHAYAAGDYATNLPLPGGFGAAFFMGKGEAQQGPGDIFFARLSVAGPRRILKVRPTRARVGLRTHFRFTAYALTDNRRLPLSRASIRFAGRRIRTDRRGRAATVATLRRPGRIRAVLRRRNGPPATASVRAVR